MHAVGWEWIVIDYVDKVAANLFDNMAKKRFSNVFTKLRVLQMENVDRVRKARCESKAAWSRRTWDLKWTGPATMESVRNAEIYGKQNLGKVTR